MVYPIVSFEVIPREDGERLQRIREIVAEGMEFDPLFIDMSFGGGRPDVDGSVRRAMHRTIAVIREFSDVVPIVPHLTRTGLDRENTSKFLREMADAGIYDFVLIGGDQPKDDVPRFREEDCYDNTNNMITGVCTLFKEWGLADKLSLRVGVEPEGFNPVARLREKRNASIIELPGTTEPIFAVKESITQNYTKRGIIFPFLIQADTGGIVMPGITHEYPVEPHKAPIELPIAIGVSMGAGIPRPALNKEGKETIRNGAPIDRYGVPLHSEYRTLFEGIDPNDKSEATRARLAAIHEKELFNTILELRAGCILGPRDIVINRIHGFTHNNSGFFRIMNRLYPGIANAPAPAGTQRAQATPGAALA